MIRFAEEFPDEGIVSCLWQQSSWSHFKEIIYLKASLQKKFYAEMCRVERWSVRTLRKKIDSMLYEWTALSKQPEELVKKEKDPGFGGLIQVQNKRREFLWVHPQFVDDY